ncbi:uncharacterized protein THITE_2106451 [Thermothielavioides terrestris NRRL 8126]|jgi:hypothetical protein|uniref:Uncharacterized protein n=1 Tax=Thermothielavioides terrestris (strain ATCC 38088 / NRRL 8126) TaxID=578455 RepID=G2QXP0_THETT|nr:uncharacterized protein THITE_2106451 [Thermothielavioides terrestris NRRL 8126]AEO62358.1 hypothetical protein THITE_2106451 [Thermothielavioides terrestris NRRL 8126]
MLFDEWDYGDMKERLRVILTKLNRPALMRHGELVRGQRLTMSEPFSAGQYWI